jgi:hypothetical protein
MTRGSCIRPLAGPLALALLLTFSAPAPGAEDEDRAAIQELLDERASALLVGDFGGFMDTIRRNQAFRERQRLMFEGFQQLPLADYRLVANWDRYGDLARRQDRNRYFDSDAVAIVLVEERYRIGGFDREAAVEDAYLTFVQEDGEWLIADDNDLDDLGLYTARHPWDFGPIRVDRAGRFLVISDAGRGCAPVPPGLTDQAEAGIDRVRDYWTARWHKRVVLVVPCNGGRLQRILQATFDPSQFVAFAYSTVDTERDYDYTGHRVIVNPPVFSGRPASQVLTIMAHELLHVASRDISGPFVPLFVDEGIADLVGYGTADRALAYFDAVVSSGGFDGKLPNDFQFSTGSGDEIFLSYQKSQSAMRFFVSRWGLEALDRFYENLGKRTYVVGLARWHVDDALRATVGIGLDRFEREWTASIGS